MMRSMIAVSGLVLVALGTIAQAGCATPRTAMDTSGRDAGYASPGMMDSSGPPMNPESLEAP